MLQKNLTFSENIKNKKMGVNRKFLWKGKSER